MTWWGWMVVGMLLLAAELFIVEANFFLVFLGAAAIVTGLIALALPELSQAMQWLAFSALALTSMIFFRRRVYRLLRREVPDMANDMLQEHLQLSVSLPVDDSCRVELRGSTWTARNVGTVPIPPGVNVRIVGVDGVTLRIEAPN
ncbi:MAG: NfeD family protein [Chromatiales bacterium]|jgi:membrane protein implicated in regulation of membrane protease activity|nr:MAG: NfeD family protein [Chromatiales bacterium]